MGCKESNQINKQTFSNYSFRITIRVSNSLDQDQDRCSVGPNLGPNYLQKLSASRKVAAGKEKVNETPELNTA